MFSWFVKLVALSAIEQVIYPLSLIGCVSLFVSSSSTVWASIKWQSKTDIDDGVEYPPPFLQALLVFECEIRPSY